MKSPRHGCFLPVLFAILLSSCGVPVESQLFGLDSELKKECSGEIPMGALVLVSSDFSGGSGFIGKVRNRYFFITNIHVLGAAKEARFTTMDGVAVPLGSTVFLSKRRDVALVPVEWSGPALNVSSSLNTDGVRIGQKIVVMGNSDGAKVITRIEGNVLGIGPDELEVSAKFVPGNSGSPILHEASGHVIAVASYLRDYTNRDRWSEDSELGNIRRFGYRLDGEMEWERIDLVELHRQSAIYHRVEKRSESMWEIVHSLAHHPEKLVASLSVHESLDNLYKRFIEDFDLLRVRGLSEGQNRRTLRRFLSKMLWEMRKDMEETEESLTVDFYRQRFKETGGIRMTIEKNIRFFSDLNGLNL